MFLKVRKKPTTPWFQSPALWGILIGLVAHVLLTLIFVPSLFLDPNFHVAMAGGVCLVGFLWGILIKVGFPYHGENEMQVELKDPSEPDPTSRKFLL